MQVGATHETGFKLCNDKSGKIEIYSFFKLHKFKNAILN